MMFRVLLCIQFYRLTQLVFQHYLVVCHELFAINAMYIFGLCYTTSIVVGIGMTFHRWRLP